MDVPGDQCGEDNVVNSGTVECLEFTEAENLIFEKQYEEAYNLCDTRYNAWFQEEKGLPPIGDCSVVGAPSSSGPLMSQSPVVGALPLLTPLVSQNPVVKARPSSGPLMFQSPAVRTPPSSGPLI